MSRFAAELALINAAIVNVERGHFQEAYEGFNDCRGHDDENLCNCGLKEARKALRLAAEYNMIPISIYQARNVREMIK